MPKDNYRRIIKGYEPQMEFEDGLKMMHEWFTGNRETIKRSAEF